MPATLPPVTVGSIMPEAFHQLISTAKSLLLFISITLLLGCGSGGGGGGNRSTVQYAGGSGTTDGAGVIDANWENARFAGAGSVSGIAADGNNVHVVVGSDTSLFYRKSSDSGNSWTDPEYIGSGTLYLVDPVVAKNNNVYVLYVEADESPVDFLGVRQSGDIGLIRSRDGGETWDAPIALTSGEQAYRYSAAIDEDGTLHLTWMDYRTGNFPPLSTDGDSGNDANGSWEIKYRRASLNGGASSDLALSSVRVLVSQDSSFGHERPVIRAFKRNLHLVWMAGRGNGYCAANEYGVEIVNCPGTSYMKSSDGGVSWSGIMNLTSGFDQYASRPHVAATNPGGSASETVVVNYDVYFSEPDNQGLDVFVTSSNNGGGSFNATSPLRISSAVGDSTHAYSAAANGRFIVAWFDTRDGSPQIMATYSADGNNWSDEEILPLGGGDTPVVAVGDDHFHMVWHSGGSIMYSRRRYR